jgi:preprotein translocase subunit YajC
VEYLPFVLVLIFFWLFLIRPQQRRAKAVNKMQSALAPGDRVMLSSGIFGTLLSVVDDRAKVEIAPGLEIEVVRAAIAQIEPAVSEDQADEIDDADEFDEADPEADVDSIESRDSEAGEK